MSYQATIIHFLREAGHLKKQITVCFFGWLLLMFLGKALFFRPVMNVDYSDANFKVLGLNLPRNLEFCGEKIPQNDYEIKESLEREFHSNKHWKSSAALFFFRAQQWFPVIEPILKREKVPDDLKYVAVIESHLSNAMSPAGAAGFWQLVPSTAQNYGLVVNGEVDERYDVEKSTVAACKHFKDAYKVFNNWTLSAAAYNLGIGGIQNALKRQNTDNYYDLMLNRETGSFVYRILAYKTLLSNPDHFGITEKQHRRGGGLPPSKTVKVDSSIANIGAFAKKLGVNEVVLRTFNPWLIGERLDNPDHHAYSFKVPKNKEVDLSVYFNDVFPQAQGSDSATAKIAADTIKKAVNDSIKK